MSLVDVLVSMFLLSMFLLSIALVGMALAFPPAYLSVFQERTVTQALTIAEGLVETARRTAYDSLPALAGTDSTTYPPYTVTTTVTPDAPAPGFTTVRVSVTGPSILGPHTPNMGPQTVEVETFVARP